MHFVGKKTTSRSEITDLEWGNTPSPHSRSYAKPTVILLLCLFVFQPLVYRVVYPRARSISASGPSESSPYGHFPKPGDPFKFIPCTRTTIPPSWDDPEPEKSWTALFDPKPENWSWGNATTSAGSSLDSHDPYAGRGIYLCGYLDAPLDHHNASDIRIVRLAVTKFQVSGLARLDSRQFSGSSEASKPGSKSERTIVLEPGGPGGSGTHETWVRGEKITQRMSGGRFDVLGWDPRGVNTSSPSASCFPEDVYRDRWSLYTAQYRAASPSPLTQLRIADAMNNATFYACWERLGDFGRFATTTHAARDMDRIRDALGEEELTGYMMSYGTGIAQLYANMFPERVGRLVLDGSVYFKDYMKLGAMGWSAIADTVDLWRDGFLAECVRAGPEHCALAEPKEDDGTAVTVPDLEARMNKLIQSLTTEPIPAYLESAGPMLITYSKFVGALYPSLYMPSTWPATARMLRELESGNSTAAAMRLFSFKFNAEGLHDRPFSSELLYLTMCADAHETLDTAGDLLWWDSLWSNFTARSWLNGDLWFTTAFSCRHFSTHWKDLKTYHGGLNSSFKNPLLLLSTTYDPATPLNNSMRLLADMGTNARLVVHHGYGHTTFFDKSNCTDAIGKAFILNGTLPDAQVSNCLANEKPYTRKQHQWW